ncbi:DUF1007 family protein [Parasulfitobacter algicola]|uniref:DUF1007 family protein n=1 Tax=Parasulfitobacter algicola TaxID=2614809 RepID=UPI0031B5D06D
METKLGLIYAKDGSLNAIRVSWTYDEFYSLLIFEDRQLDPDYNGELTSEELAVLDGFDLNWVDGFEGDLYLDGAKLGSPVPDGIKIEANRIVTSHIRPIIGSFDNTKPAVISAYDPTYYTAYEINADIVIEGTQDCSVQLEKADIAAATDLLEEMLFAMPASDAEEYFPEVGRAFSDRVIIKCASS